VVASARKPASVVQHLVHPAAAHVAPAPVVQGLVIQAAALQAPQLIAELGKQFRRLFSFHRPLPKLGRSLLMFQFRKSVRALALFAVL